VHHDNGHHQRGRDLEGDGDPERDAECYGSLSCEGGQATRHREGDSGVVPVRGDNAQEERAQGSPDRDACERDG